MENKEVSTYLQQLEALNKSDHQQFLTLYKKLADLAENKTLQSNSLPWHNLNLEVNKSFKIERAHDEQSSNVPFNLENLFEWNYLNDVKNDLQNLIQHANFNEHKIELESNSVDGHFNILIQKQSENLFTLKFQYVDCNDVRKQALMLLSQNVFEDLDRGFSDEFVRELSQSLNIPYIIIGRLISENTVRTASFYLDGKYKSEVEYELKNTPCEHVYKEEQKVFPSQLQQLFPKDDFLKAHDCEGYAGVALFDQKNKKLIGHLALMTTSKLKKPQTKIRFITVFGQSNFP